MRIRIRWHQDMHTVACRKSDYERLYPLLVETDFPDELIMNYWPDKFLALLSDKGR